MASPWTWQSGAPSFVAAPTDPGHRAVRTWNRPFWGAEIAFAAGTLANPGFADMLISCHIHMPPSVSFDGELVRAATRSMRYRHPTIAATLLYPIIEHPQDFSPMNGRLVYEAPRDEADVNSWLDESVQDRSSLLDQTHGKLDEAIALLRLELGAVDAKRSRWMFEVFYLTSRTGTTHAILFHLGHTLFDGIGSFEVLDLWLHALAKVSGSGSRPDSDIEWGSEGARLAGPVPDRANAPWRAERTPADHYILEQIRKGLTRPPFQFGLPILKPQAEPGNTGTILKTLPSPTASLLRNAARKHNCGVFSVILAANYLCILNIHPPKDFTGELYAHLFPNATDLRGKYLAGGPAAKRDRSTWQVTSALGANIIVAHNLERFLKCEDLTAAVWQLALEIQEQVAAQQPYQETAFQWVPDAMGLLMQSAFFSEKPVHQSDRVVNISSLGVVDDSLAKVYPLPKPSDQSVEISDPIFSGIGPALQVQDVLAIVHPYTWQDVLYLSFSFPMAYMGTLEEQYIAASKGEVTMHAYTEAFASLLKRLAEC